MARLVFCFIFMICSCTLNFLVQASGEVPVPVLLWSPEKRMSDHEMDVAQVLKADNFHDLHLSPIMKDASMAAVLFLQDKLHTDDFTQFADVYSVDGEGGALANIKNLMEENFSLEVPEVVSPMDALRKLKSGFEGRTHTVGSVDELEKLNLESDGAPFLLIVQLPATDGKVDREAALKANDEMIGHMCKHLSKRSIKYVAAFTGMAPSQGMAEEGEAHNSRHLLAEAVVPKNNGTFMNISGTSFLYIKTIDICVKHKDDPSKCVTNFTLTPVNSSASSSTVGNKSAIIDLVFSNEKSGAATYDIKIVTNAIDQGDRWVISNITLFITPQDKSKNGSNIQNATLSQGDMDFVVPILYSFHCTEMKMYIDSLQKGSEDFKGTYVQFNGYQFQPFNIQNDKFFQSVDCVGFFTSAIWMGLFPAALLLLILLYGTMMLLDLSIMDRYDDPKGKTITVHASSE